MSLWMSGHVEHLSGRETEPDVYIGPGPEIVLTEVFAAAVVGWRTVAGSFLGWAGSAAVGSPL